MKARLSKSLVFDAINNTYILDANWPSNFRSVGGKNIQVGWGALFRHVDGRR